MHDARASGYSECCAVKHLERSCNFCLWVFFEPRGDKQLSKSGSTRDSAWAARPMLRLPRGHTYPVPRITCMAQPYRRPDLDWTSRPGSLRKDQIAGAVRLYARGAATSKQSKRGVCLSTVFDGWESVALPSPRIPEGWEPGVCADPTYLASRRRAALSQGSTNCRVKTSGGCRFKASVEWEKGSSEREEAL